MPAARWALEHLPRWAWKGLDLATVLWELGLVSTVWNRKLFRLGLAFGALFHFAVLQLFGIAFTGNVVVYTAFAGYAWLPRRVVPALPAAWLGPVARGLAVACFGAAGLYALWRGEQPLSSQLDLPVGELVLSAGLLVAAAYVGHELWRVLYGWRGRAGGPAKV